MPGNTNSRKERGGEQRLPIRARRELGDVLRAFGKGHGYCARANRIQELQSRFNAGLVLIRTR
jgi:hypothetical protein